MNLPPNELEPWIIVQGTSAQTSLALWKISSSGGLALAMFTQQELAAQYANENCEKPFETLRVSSASLIRVMIDCFRSGIEYAALNPSKLAASRVFVVRDVLNAAKQHLERNNSLS